MNLNKDHKFHSLENYKDIKQPSEYKDRKIFKMLI